MILRNPKPNCHKVLPHDVWVTIGSFLVPHQMEKLDRALAFQEDPIANKASELALLSLRKIADKFWDESAAIHGTRCDEDLSILEQLVANDRSPLANQLHIARESLRIQNADLPCGDKLVDGESWYSVYTFLYRFLVFIWYDLKIQDDIDFETIDVFRLRKDFLAVVIWMTFGTPALPITILNYRATLRVVQKKWNRLRQMKKRYFSKLRICDVGKRWEATLYYDRPGLYSASIPQDADDAFEMALGDKLVTGCRVTAGMYLLKNDNLKDCIAFILEDYYTNKYRPSDIEEKGIFGYFYLLVIYRYGSFHPVTKKLRQESRATLGDRSLSQIYALVVSSLERFRHRFWCVDAVLKESWIIESDEVSDSNGDRSDEEFERDGEDTIFLNNFNEYRTYSPGSANIELQRRRLYVSAFWQ